MIRCRASLFFYLQIRRISTPVDGKQREQSRKRRGLPNPYLVTERKMDRLKWITDSADLVFGVAQKILRPLGWRL